MKKYLALILFALLTTLAIAQSNYQDVVYLKNGSIIRGVVIEQIPNKSIKIETFDKSVFVYQMDEIEKLTKEQIKVEGKSPVKFKGFEKGYKAIVEIGFGPGVGNTYYNYSMDRFKINIINGYQLNPYFSIGLGTGLRYYPTAEEAIVPVFADFRANLLKRNVTPYISLGIGYSFDATNGFKNVGFLFNPIAGINFKVSDKSSMNVGLGYEMQNMEYYDYIYDYKYVEDFGAISINVGVSF